MMRHFFSIVLLCAFMGPSLSVNGEIYSEDFGDGMCAENRGDGFFSLHGTGSYSWKWPSTAVRIRRIAAKYTLSSTGVTPYVVDINEPVRCTLIQMKEGDTISYSTITSATKCFQRVHMFCPEDNQQSGIVSDYSISYTPDATIYLGFVMYDASNSPCSTGWIRLRLGYNWIEVESCALDDEGGDLVVGRSMGAVPADGGTWQHDVYVDANGTGSDWGYTWRGAWGSICDGVRALRENNAVIHVRPGVYGAVPLEYSLCFESNAGYNVTIESTDGPSVTFIDGGGYALDANGVPTSGVWCTSLTRATSFLHVTLRGFTLRNGLGAAHGVERLENCRIENCHYGLSNTFTTACTLSNVHSPLAPGSGIRATISSTSAGFRVSPLTTPQSPPPNPFLLGSISLSSRVWSVTTNFDDAAFMSTNRFFTIGVRRED